MRENTDRWMQLCAQAATEEEPTKLIAPVNEINHLLEQQERRFALIPARKVNSDG